jgi:hypothetical protein
VAERRVVPSKPGNAGGGKPVRFDERDVENGAKVRLLRHRQTKGAAKQLGLT